MGLTVNEIVVLINWDPTTTNRGRNRLTIQYNRLKM